MAENKSQALKRAEVSFINSLRDKGVPKKKGRPSKDALIHKALQENSTTFFKTVLDDATEEKLWWMFIDGRIPELDADGNQMRTEKGTPIYREISGVSWNAFRQMVAYKRGMPAITEADKNPEAGKITVHFNVMGASYKEMEEQAREMGTLPKILTQKV